MPPRKDAILKVRISEDLKREAEEIATRTGETVAVIVRQALREYLDRHRERLARDRENILWPKDYTDHQRREIAKLELDKILQSESADSPHPFNPPHHLKVAEEGKPYGTSPSAGAAKDSDTSLRSNGEGAA
jgi:hypothetical protein